MFNDYIKISNKRIGYNKALSLLFMITFIFLMINICLEIQKQFISYIAAYFEL